MMSAYKVHHMDNLTSRLTSLLNARRLPCLAVSITAAQRDLGDLSADPTHYTAMTPKHD